MATAAVFHPTPKQSFFGWVPRKETHAVVRLTAPVRAPAAYTDFSSSFLSANLLGSPSRRRTVTVSIVTHTILVGVPLLLSLWFTNTLDLRTYTQTLLVAPPAAAAPSPPPKVVAAQPVHPSRRVFTSQGKLILPTAIPKQIAMLKEEPLPPEDNGGVFGGIPGGVTGGVLGGILEGLKAPEAPAVPRPAEPPRAPVLVGGNVQPPRIISQVTPEYPVLAKQAGIQGEVIISAVIDSAGKVVDMKVVSGPPLLFASAMKALAQWKFEPTYLNGEPVAIRWNASVKFRIGAARQVS
jgi:periplasmic protein TonB